MSVIVKGKNAVKPHTVRYWADGRQRERSFETLGEAKAFRTDTDHAARYGGALDTRKGRESFGTAAETYLARLPCSPRSRTTYASTYRAHVAPVLGSRTLAAVANDRDAVASLLTETMGPLSISVRRRARMIVLGTLGEAVKAGKIPAHRCGDIDLADEGVKNGHDGFVFPSHAQVAQVAESAGIAVWLMRGCGLRIEEALAVEKADFRDGGHTLRVSGQASLDGRARVPLKKRRAGECRDVPCPRWLWDMVRNMPDGPLQPGRNGRRYEPYSAVSPRFMRAAAAAGIPPKFHPHSLRHAFASAMLASGVPLSDLAVWLGHRDVNTTYATYSHLVPSAAGRAADVLDAEYAAWSAESH